MAKQAKPGKPKDAASDKKMVKAGVHQHESAMHPGKKKTKLKLGTR